MQTAPLVIPRHIVQQRVRPPKKNIPQTTLQRHHILHVVRNYVAEYNPVPPLPVEVFDWSDPLMEEPPRPDEHGRLRVTGPGFGVTLDRQTLERLATLPPLVL